MDKNSLDSFLTNEPNNSHYDKWLDKVLGGISEDEISQYDFDSHFDSFIEPLLLKLSTSGTMAHGFVSPSFASDVIKRRFRLMMEDKVN